MDLSALIKKAISLPKPVTTTNNPSTSSSSSSSRKRSHPNSTHTTRSSTTTSTTTTTTTSSSSSTLTDLAEEPILLILEHCSRSPEEFSSAWHYLSTELFKGNVNTRLRTLDVIDALFHSSHDFRTIVTESIDTIARSAGLVRVLAKGNAAVPQGADVLAPRVLELLALWDHVYGTRYGRLHAMKRYVSEGERIAMPNIQRRLVEMRKERERCETIAKRKTELRTRNIIERDLTEDLHRMRQSLSTIEGCLGLLFPSPEQQVMVVMDEEGFENISWEGGDEEHDNNGAGLGDALAGAAPFTLELQLDLSSDSSSEQDAVRDCLAEAAKEAATVLLPRLVKSRQALLDVKEHLEDNQHVLVALSELDAVLRKARSLLSERCRPLLTKSSTST
eukprot:gene2179-2378_t